MRVILSDLKGFTKKFYDSVRTDKPILLKILLERDVDLHMNLGGLIND